MNKKKVGILLFNEVEVLDFAGPFGVFSLAESVQDNKKLFNVLTVTETNSVIKARNGLKVVPDYSFDNVPALDILIVPGGYGAEKIEIKNKELLNWLKKMSRTVEVIASVCTGAFLLAESKVIENHKVTTHWMGIHDLQERYPELKVKEKVRFIHEGKILTSAGISAGIELSLHIVERYSSK